MSDQYNILMMIQGFTEPQYVCREKTLNAAVEKAKSYIGDRTQTAPGGEDGVFVEHINDETGAVKVWDLEQIVEYNEKISPILDELSKAGKSWYRAL